MQALCKLTDNSPDILCPVCGKGFRLYWERSSYVHQQAALPEIQQALRDHHKENPFAQHPQVPFNVPSWSGLPQFSAAALLGGAA